MNKQQLSQRIWAAANKMRSKIEANEYKDYILGFIFYKYLSDKEEKFLKESGSVEEEFPEIIADEGGETFEYIRDGIGYYISYKNLFSTWLNMGKDFDVSNVRDALSAFNRLISPSHKKVFDKIFDTLQAGLSKLGDTSGSQTKAIRDLLYLIKDIPMDGKQGYDVLGFIYEDLIGKFAANAGKKAGEFYTPHEVSVLMSDIIAEHLKGRENIKIYDPTSGSGSLLINIGKSISRHINQENTIKYYAQELMKNTYDLTRMNLVMRGILPDNIVTRNADTLEEDWPYFDESDPANTYDPLYVDAVVSNPPYSKDWEPAGKESDPRYARFGLAPKGKADYAFLLHDLYHVKPDGIMAIVLPHGVLFRGGEEGQIRKNLIEYNHIDAIIGLPANIFFGTGIPTIVMILKQQRENTDVLIIDASKGFMKEGKNNKLRSSDIKKIADTVKSRLTIEKYSKVVSREEIRANDYNLNIPRYVDSSEKTETWDIYAAMFGGIPKAEINELSAYWKAFPGLKKSLFTESDTPYVHMKTEDIKNLIQQNDEVRAFEAKCHEAYEDFGGFMKEYLIEKMDSVERTKGEDILSNELFRIHEDIPLVDSYGSFELLSERWSGIEADLELIQTEGFDSVRSVVPHLVSKKKDGKEQEIQEGWEGAIIPFSLVQSTLLKDKSEALKEKENRLSSIPSEYEEILGELTEDQKERVEEALTEDRTGFVFKEISKVLKTLKKDRDEETISLRNQLEKVEELNRTEKTLKAQIRTETAELHEETKCRIESLTDEEALHLLEEKWILPLVRDLKELPDSIVNKLVSKLKEIEGKYETTLSDLEKEIRETEQNLADMMDDLVSDEFNMKGILEFQALLRRG